jgi:hypothetical protein
MQNTQNTSIENLAAIGNEIDESGLTFVSGGKPKHEVSVSSKCDTEKKCEVTVGYKISW